MDVSTLEFYSLFCSQFMLLMWTVKERYKLINDYFITMMICQNSFELKNSKLRNVMRLNNQLIKIVDDISFYYGLPMIMIIGVGFLVIILCTFVGIKISITENNWNHFSISFAAIFYNIILLSYFIGIVSVGHWVKSEFQKTVSLVHKFLTNVKDEKIIKTFLDFSFQLLHRKPNFCCGLFSFDLKLAFTMFGAAATYLVIAIQMDTAVSKHV
ncbi:CLUMA_CG018792, isoform A [Clunio marinus]|uniref:CLUMA_CG018792, isoform A n=1 Tax=Clunio marinus TaxID=568069 RepID=A0A1J1IZS3_9DIPT|nr:CLUMA_CG018792, isoform A [Clunio marinus]